MDNHGGYCCPWCDCGTLPETVILSVLAKDLDRVRETIQILREYAQDDDALSIRLKAFKIGSSTSPSHPRSGDIFGFGEGTAGCVVATGFSVRRAAENDAQDADTRS